MRSRRTPSRRRWEEHSNPAWKKLSNGCCIRGIRRAVGGDVLRYQGWPRRRAAADRPNADARRLTALLGSIVDPALNSIDSSAPRLRLNPSLSRKSRADQLD